MKRADLSNDVMLVSPQRLPWFAFGALASFGVTLVGGRNERLEWLLWPGLLGLLVTSPVAIRTSAVLIGRQFEPQFRAAAKTLGFGAAMVGGVATVLAYIVAGLLALLVAAFVVLGIVGLLLIGIRAL